MSVDPSTMAQLLSMSVLSGNQSQSDQSSPFSGQTNSNFTNLLSAFLLLMENSSLGSNETADQSAAGFDSLAYTPYQSLDSTDTSESENTDNLLWQQLSTSLSPLGLTQGLNTSSLGHAAALSGSSNTNDYNETIQAMSKKYSVDANLIRSVIDAESGGNPNATSAAGAQGLMQLMPGTAVALGVQNAYDPVQNIEGGTKYLRKLLDRYDNNYNLALAAYNAGSGNVAKYGGVPPFAETQSYVKKIMDKIQSFQA